MVWAPAELQTAAVIYCNKVSGWGSHSMYTVRASVYECVSLLCAQVDRYWSMSAACSVSLSSPQHWSPLRDLWSPGADPQPNYVGGAQLDCMPIHLPHSTWAQKQRGTFHFSTAVNAGFCQDHKSPEETEWKCSHKLLSLNLTSGQQTRCSPSVQRPCQASYGWDSKYLFLFLKWTTSS